MMKSSHHGKWVLDDFDYGKWVLVNFDSGRGRPVDERFQFTT